MNIGSYPHPPPAGLRAIFPGTAAEKILGVLPELYAMTERNEAFLFEPKRRSIPELPMVERTYDEYGPGNPPSESTNSPASSTMRGCFNKF